MSEKCDATWEDGWAPEHECHWPKGHVGDHRCRCDAFISQWAYDHQDDIAELAETNEEARQRLRRELLAMQSATTDDADGVVAEQ